MAKDDTRIAVIMPPELHMRLVALAQAERRSLNSYLVVLLEKHADEKEKNHAQS
jgi:predicted HicB family RNase H-like nuclease